MKENQIIAFFKPLRFKVIYYHYYLEHSFVYLFKRNHFQTAENLLFPFSTSFLTLCNVSPLLFLLRILEQTALSPQTSAPLVKWLLIPLNLISPS